MIMCVWLSALLLISSYGLTFGQQARDLAQGIPTDSAHLDKVELAVAMAEDYGWKFEAGLSKPITILYERIYINLKITNMSGESRPTPELGDQFLDITYRLYDSRGETVPLMRWRANVIGRPDSTRRLAAGESHSLIFDLLLILAFDSSIYAGDIQKLLPGEYTLELSLYLDPFHRIPRERYTLTLPPLHFRVIQPTGDTAEALEIFRAGLFAKKEDPERALDFFDKILTSYSTTPYDLITNEYMLKLLIFERYYDAEKLKRMRIRFFLKYPGSLFNRPNVSELIPTITREEMRQLYRQIQDDEGAALTIQYLKEQHPWIFEPEETDE